METGRRPSRRAAQLAVEKIQNAVREFGLTENAIERQLSHTVSPIRSEQKRVITPSKAVSSRDKNNWHSARAPIPNIDLMMECHEELLSAIQAETILKAQMEYNAVMKRLRNLKASNAKIICINHDEDIPPSSPVPILPAVLTKAVPAKSVPAKVTNVVTLTPVGASPSPNVVTIVPIKLVTV